MAAARTIIREDPGATRSYKAMRDRGLSKKQAEEEIARALLGCSWEASRGFPDRWSAVLKALEEGKSVASLFPDEFYTGPPGSRQ
jgi:hypothetical protein